MSVVNAKVSASNPGSVRSLTGGTSSTCSIATRERSGASRSSTAAPGVTVRNSSSASALGGITFGAMPPLTRPTE